MALAPKLASTVILAREKDPAGFEVFLLRRHQKSIFMAGNYVYPGGTVDRADDSEELNAHCKESSGEGMGGLRCAGVDLLSHRVAAIRELFEEAGVLLAYKQDGALFRPSNDAERRKFSAYRDKLNAGEITLLNLAKQENLFLAPDQLQYYAHWITPEANFVVRFDTRFFIARHPSGQEASPDLKETTDGIWIAPRPALDANIQGSVPLSPPTLKTLEDLARFAALKLLLESLQDAEKKPTVLPVAATVAGEGVLIYPWDPEYEAYKRGVIDQSAPGPYHGSPSTPSDNTTRLVFRGGRWLPYVK